MALIVTLVNESNLTDISDYRVEVLIGDGSAGRSRTIYRGIVKQHCRADGWEALIRLFADGLAASTDRGASRPKARSRTNPHRRMCRSADRRI